jgi:hypothetical protein
LRFLRFYVAVHSSPEWLFRVLRKATQLNWNPTLINFVENFIIYHEMVIMNLHDGDYSIDLQNINQIRKIAEITSYNFYILLKDTIKSLVINHKFLYSFFSFFIYI